MQKIKYFIPTIILMIIIFIFSNQTGTYSSGFSLKITQYIHHIFFFLPFDTLHFTIRKITHMCEYALLLCSFYYSFSHCQLSYKKIYLFSIMSTFLYACSDEIHQLFINGRAGQVTDVCIDTLAAFIALSIIYIIKKRNIIVSFP